MPRRLALAFLLALAGCIARPSFDDPSMGGPDLVPEEFFNGRLIAHGQFQDTFGEVRSRFSVALTGDRYGESLTLEEVFTFEDGTTESRLWTLRPTGPGAWSGTAPGVVGEAVGRSRGDTFNLSFMSDVSPGGGGFRAHFDQWLWRVDDDRVLNRVYLSRFGIDFGEVIMIFERLD